MNSAPLITAVRGPVVLIGLGVLFALDYFGSYRFTQTWPALIILYGVMKLLERAFQPEAGGPVMRQGGVS